MRPSLATKVRALSGLLVALLIPAIAGAQQAVLQGGAVTRGHVPTYSSQGTGQPIVIDSGPAGGNTTGQGLSELNVTARGTGTAPYASQGTGPNGEVVCIQDAVSTNATGYHALCFSANAAGGGLLSYDAFGAASTLPFSFKVNGTTYDFPFVTGGIVGPSSTTVGHVAVWNNTTGTLLGDSGTALLTIGGSDGQIQYNNSGALGGFTMAGDCTLSQPTITCTKVNGKTVNLGGTLTTAAAFTQAGAFATTLTSVGVTTVTLPQTGTLATLAGTEALTNKSINGMTITPSTGTYTLTNGKTFSVTNTLTLSGTDSSTLNIGSGGTLGTAAYTSATAYIPAGTQIANSIGSNVSLNNTGQYFTGPSVAQGGTGTWFASGTVTLQDTAGAASFYCKLWDGTTVVSSAGTAAFTTNALISISLSGYLSSPAGNLRISCRDETSTSGVMRNDVSSNGKDSTITAFRVQ